MLAKGPFRADTVGSMLRTKVLKDAREKHEKKTITDAQLQAIEDKEIAALVKRLEGIGLTGITDGEFRRSWWHFDFLEHLTGVEGYTGDSGIKFHGVETRPKKVRVVGKLACKAANIARSN